MPEVRSQEVSWSLYARPEVQEGHCWELRKAATPFPRLHFPAVSSSELAFVFEMFPHDGHASNGSEPRLLEPALPDDPKLLTVGKHIGTASRQCHSNSWYEIRACAAERSIL